jgi:hypothetical protein
MSDEWETFCDVSYYHMWRLRRKTERGWNDGFHINTKAEAEGLCELLNKLERERDEARAVLVYEQGGIHATAGGWAAKYAEAIEQRDRLAEELKEAQNAIEMMLRDSSCRRIPAYTEEQLAAVEGGQP